MYVVSSLPLPLIAPFSLKTRQTTMNYGSRCNHEKQPHQHHHLHKIIADLISFHNHHNNNNHSPIKSFFSSLFFIPTSIILVVLVLLLVYNSFNIFYVHIPPSPLTLLNSSASSSLSSFSSLQPSILLPDISSSSDTASVSINNYVITQGNQTLISSSYTRKKRRRRRKKRANKTISASQKNVSKHFSERVKEFFFSSSSSSSSSRPCKLRFFMTWISSLESFSRREALTIESLFRSHLNACLLIVSASMDSDKGLEKLRPFLDQNLRVMAVAPDLEFLFKNTTAATWFEQLKRGRVKPGEISLAQNLSNLLRLALLYKYGGIYMDTDFIILRPLLGLRNVIGAQNSDPRSGQWTRLNNALMIFDKRHPLVGKFIDEFASTFNGNKWGHNGPYLVSRVVKRVTTQELPGQLGLNFTVLPPWAFYPVDWGRIGRLFRRWEEEEERWWMLRREEKIKKESYGVHLWNRQTRSLKVENGSVIARLMLNSCLFCNFTSETFEI